MMEISELRDSRVVPFHAYLQNMDDFFAAPILVSSVDIHDAVFGRLHVDPLQPEYSALLDGVRFQYNESRRTVAATVTTLGFSILEHNHGKTIRDIGEAAIMNGPIMRPMKETVRHKVVTRRLFDYQERGVHRCEVNVFVDNASVLSPLHDMAASTRYSAVDIWHVAAAYAFTTWVRIPEDYKQSLLGDIDRFGKRIATLAVEVGISTN